jgi:hypothetical protein
VNIAELNSKTSGTGTINTTNCSSGQCNWRRAGNIVIVDLYDVFPKTTANNQTTVLFSGLPKAKFHSVARINCAGSSYTSPMRVGIAGSSTNIYIWWDTTLKVGASYTGQLIYVAES